ncbi:hypothetical protein RhiirC2_788822 [Rhizophagus irregularis]|uniref:RNase H type-1 domain-containing protein n=1 Tax=Rhizophagus irregularis TaxID=588596 RepID=A0A2N1MPB8_9GLOM|nr:hypothetical protein RhiirC2_788822 [Rhizophagus irregularis]
MQIVPDAGFPNSIATYAHGIIRDNPFSSRAEAVAIYAVLTISPRDSEVTIYTDSQTAIDGLRDYVVDWNFTWFTLQFEPSHDASFTFEHASQHQTFKFKLFLDELPMLEKLKIAHLDLYMDELTCFSCIDCMEDLMHLFMCKKRHLPIELQIGQPNSGNLT